ncbi:CoA transferase, partial [Tsukamurella paurometabola]
MTNLLDGVRVVELAPLLSGALAGMTLADLGADVIKVEPPGGDLLRHVFGALAPGFSPPFVQLNRGKRSVTADMDAEDDRTFVAELARDAD